MKKHTLNSRSKPIIIYTLVWSCLLLLIVNNTTGYAQSNDKQTLYRDYLKKGDSFLAAKNYAAAMFEYEKASDLMPNEEEPKLKMQGIEATLGEKELAEVRRKVDIARKQEQEQLKKVSSAKTTKTGVSDVDKFARERQTELKRDSLRKVIFDTFAEELRQAEKGTDMIARAVVYRKIADAFRKINDDEIALNYYTKALEIEEKYGKQKDVSNVYEKIADTYYNSGDLQNSISSYEKSLTLKEKAGDKEGASEVLSSIANVYETGYDYKNAINFYQKSADIKDSIKDESGLKDVMNDLGDVYYKQKILASSILSYEKTVNIIQKLNMDEALGPVYNKLGVAHYEMGNYNEAEKFFTESLKNLNENRNKKEASMTLNNLGNLLYINNKFTDAISYYERSIASKKETNYDFGMAVTLFNLGNAYRRTGNHELALKNYEKSRRIADSLDFQSLSSKNMKAMAASYEASKNFDRAAEMDEELKALGLTSVSIEVPISENEMDLEREKTQVILSKLNEEALKRKELTETSANNKMADNFINNINNQFRKEQGKTRMLITLSAALGALLLGMIFLYIRRKKS
jgi:tetratricopeptide (TPR) repeat protein